MRIVRPALVAQELPGKDHVVGGDRLAVGEFRGRIEREGDVGAVGVGFDRAGEQAVERERLVIAARQQALDHVAAHLRQREAFDDERVEAVEGAEHALRQPAALGRGRVGVAGMVEAGGQRRLAVHGDAVLRDARPRQRAGTRRPTAHQKPAKPQRVRAMRQGHGGLVRRNRRLPIGLAQAQSARGPPESRGRPAARRVKSSRA